MAILNQAANLNLIPGISAQVVVHLSQGNVGDTLTFYLYSGSETFAETGVAVALNGVRKDGAGFTAPCIIVGNKVTVTVTEGMTALEGYALAELVITDGNSGSVGTANFALAIEEGTFPNGPTYDTDISVYQQILQYVQSYPAIDQARIEATVNEAVGAERTERIEAESEIRADYGNRLTAMNEKINSEADARQGVETKLLSSLFAETAERKESDSILQTQIDQLVAPEGEAPSPAEVENARIGYDAVQYSSMGAAIRTQVSNLHGITNYSGLMERTYFSNVMNGVIIGTDGNMVNSAGSYCTPYIPVNGVVNINVNRAYSITGGYNIAWFDDNHAFLGGQAFATLGAQTDIETVYPPTGAKYIVICNQGSGYSASDYVESPINLDVNADYERTYMMDFEDGHYINNSGVYIANSGWFTTNPIPVYGVYHIYMVSATALKTTGVNVAFYTQSQVQPFNMTFVSGYSLTDGLVDAWGVVPDGVTHMVICQPISRRNAANYVETLPHPWSKLRLNTATAIYNFFKAPVPFTEVDIAPGVYDLYAAGFSADIVADFIYYPYLANVIIHGNGATLKCNCPKSVAEEHPTGANACSIINDFGNVSIDNLTLNASNIRYAIHSECQAAKPAYDSRHTYCNVNAINAVTAAEGTVNGNAVGIGASRGQLYEFDGCNFQSTGNTPAVYFHGRLENFDGITFRNCTFNGGTGTGIVASQYTGNDIAIPVDIYDSVVGNIRCVKQSGGESYTYQFVVTAINSYVPHIYAGSGVEFLSAPRRINSITGTIDSTYEAA